MLLKAGLVLTGVSYAESPGLVSYWKFDEAFGRIAFDSSGNENHGKLVGEAAWMPAGGKFDGAVAVGGTNNDGAIEIPTKGILPQAGTVALWATLSEARRRVIKHKRYFFSYGKSPNAIQLYMENSDTELCLGLGNDHRKHKNILSLNADTWYHLSVTWSKGNYAVYVDGVQKAAGTYNGLNKSELTASIGNHPRDKDKSFHGLFDEVAVFDRAMSEDEIAQLYRQGVTSFVGGPTLGTFIETIPKAQSILNEQGAQKTIVFIQEKIAEYERWRKTNPDPNNAKILYATLSFDLYFMLAKAKEAAGMPLQNVIEAYQQSVLRPLPNKADSVRALLRLFEKLSAQDYIDTLKKCVRNNSVAPGNVYYIADYLRLNDAWAPFKTFLDTVFSESETAASYAKALAKGLKEDEAWNEKFLEYFRNKSLLEECFIEGYEKMVQKAIEQQKFSKVVEIYRDIAGQCSSGRNRVIYELKICEFFFLRNEYQNAITEVDRFLIRNKAAGKSLAQKALMIKGRSHIRLGENDKALDAFLTLVIEHPESEKTPEVRFFIGYIYMMESNFEEATRAFDTVVQEYPESSHADKARMYLTRIKTLTK
jgi:tetratricopeptide (TPR) repeat protein